MDMTRFDFWKGPGVIITLCVTLFTTAHSATAPNDDGLNQTIKGGVISDPLWELDVPRQDVEPVIMGFVQAYESGDINRFMRLFKSTVKSDSGERASRELRDEYREIFLGTTERHIIIRNTRWSHVEDQVIADADLLTSMVSKRDDQRHQRSGALRIYLGREGKEWRIEELYYAYDN